MALQSLFYTSAISFANVNFDIIDDGLIFLTKNFW